MAEEEKKNSNTSFFIYTALIFIVAIVIVILAFLGQRHTYINDDSKEKASSITDVTERVSKENARLYGEINSLNKTIEERNSTIEEKDAIITGYDNILKAENYLEAGNPDMARTYFDAVDPSILTGEMKVTYDKINAKLTE